MRIIKNKKLEKFSAYLIFISAILIAMQTYRFESTIFHSFFRYADITILVLFAVEFMVRFHRLRISKIPSIDQKIESSYLITAINDETRWLIFDGLILLASFVGTFLIILDYAEFIFIARLIRAFRIFRLFGLSTELKSIQKKIFWTFRTVSVFLFLLSIVIFVYSVIGVLIFDYQDLGMLNFSNLHHAFISLSVVLIDGLGEAYVLVSNFQGTSQWLSLLYLCSFALISIMIALNVFIAVLTNQVWDNVHKQSDTMLKKAIEKEIKESEKNLLSQVNSSQQIILKKLNELEKLNKYK
ncbi:MAG: ion transporter [Flavobacteriaceae bacterium]|nr:ion transporter [Flavobacteriaceae bacterium]